MDILDISEEKFNVRELVTTLNEFHHLLQELMEGDSEYNGELDEVLETLEYLLQEIDVNMSEDEFYAEKFEHLKADLEFVLEATVEFDLINDDIQDEFSRKKRADNFEEIEEW